VNEVSKIINNILSENGTEKATKDEILQYCYIVINQNYFQYDDVKYTQTDGLAIGAPTSLLFSEVYLQYLEHTKLVNNSNKYTIIGLQICR
jgi:hypothetical protein